MSSLPTMELEWEEPPTEALERANTTTTMYGKLAKALRERPGVWAKVPNTFASEASAKNTAMRLRSGRMVGVEKGELEVVHHETTVWARAIEKAEKKAPGSQKIIEPSTPEAAKIRAWATSQGITVSERGRLPQDLLDRYEDAHP